MPDVAPDGSPVAFYRRLPATGERELIDSLLPPSATILEVGCGAVGSRGRLLRSATASQASTTASA